MPVVLGERSGVQAIAPLARRMRIYPFAGDVEAVQSRRLDELKVVPNEWLEALGWEIFLLASARGDTREDALRLAKGDSFRVRMKVRGDLRARSIREMEK
jgi:hypothetical protein